MTDALANLGADAAQVIIRLPSGEELVARFLIRPQISSRCPRVLSIVILAERNILAPSDSREILFRLILPGKCPSDIDIGRARCHGSVL
jgi:hypothetical protein